MNQSYWPPSSSVFFFSAEPEALNCNHWFMIIQTLVTLSVYPKYITLIHFEYKLSSYLFIYEYLTTTYSICVRMGIISSATRWYCIFWAAVHDAELPQKSCSYSIFTPLLICRIESAHNCRITVHHMSFQTQYMFWVCSTCRCLECAIQKWAIRGGNKYPARYLWSHFNIPSTEWQISRGF